MNFAPRSASAAQSKWSSPQSIPAGELVTTPGPDVTTTSCSGLNDATSEVSPSTTSAVHGPAAQRASLQPANVFPEPGVAVAVTCVPGGYASWQPLSRTPGSHLVSGMPVARSMPGGETSTTPLPFGNTCSVAAVAAAPLLPAPPAQAARIAATIETPTRRIRPLSPEFPSILRSVAQPLATCKSCPVDRCVTHGG